ncbi:serine/threonine-protein kinase [Paractinoplanes rishiriensis]|uniref:non-specific serine/threonine protein kinase n=1 Tax=Paractinoplanes rishiriensis TaxID=1050105 RepID=A0A919JXB8_9ACTN|nr:serine/threonine-protein kinase [Actinoplanes rishiriensis]GIE92681.1 hypothetical protein Ari01nite_01460 [Actinoplanes rishiriensis]
MSTTDLPGSSLLAGRYRLVERLGAGGMSVVWRGFDEVLGRQVAVKVLPPSTSADPAFRRRLRAEAQAAARLSHPNITNVYDYGEATTVDGEPVPYVVMELIDGESLAAVLARARRLPWQHAVRITAEVSAALAAAHSRGIVHRDVTPANVMLTPSGAKVVDFGISALIGENDIDPDGSLLGTPAYLAPERLEGGQVSPATDVYAVGLLIYRTLIGQLPWDVGTTTALLRAHQYTEPDPLPPVEGMPHAVSALVGRCLEKRPDDRPSSAELAHVLASIAAGAPESARGYVPDWAESGEDTTILPSAQRSYPDVIRRDPPPAPARGSASAAIPPSAPVAGEPPAPARNSRFAGLRTGPVVAAAAGAPALRKAYGDDAPDQGEGNAARSGKAATRGSNAAKHNRRVLVVAGAVVLLGLTTYGLSLAAGPASQRDLGANPQPSVVPATGKCVVSYAVQEDVNGKFTANVTVANRNDAAIDAWKLWFILPGDQVIVPDGKSQLVQKGNTVTVTSKGPLDSLDQVIMPLNGTYAHNNAAPLAFMLNNRTCETFVSAKPGEPVRQVEHLSDGNVRLSTSPTTRNPVPGISIDPTGGVHITPTTPPTAGSTTGATTGTTTGTTTQATTDPPAPAPPTTTPPTTVPTTEPTTAAPTTSPTKEAPPTPTETDGCDLEDPTCVLPPSG